MLQAITNSSWDETPLAEMTDHISVTYVLITGITG